MLNCKLLVSKYTLYIYMKFMFLQLSMFPRNWTPEYWTNLSLRIICDFPELTYTRILLFKTNSVPKALA